MKTRIISGCILAPLLVFVFLGGIWLKIFALAVTILALYEFFTVHHKDEIKASFPIAVGSAVLLYCFSFFHLDPVFYLLWLFVSVLASLLYLFNIHKRISEDAMLTITGIAYITFFMFHLAWIADLGDYARLAWLVVITAFVTDIAAYFGGYFLGKYHIFGDKKLCPSISPKKTREGAVCGVLGSALVSLAFGILFTEGLWLHCLIIGIIGSVFAQLGDLTASIFKRKLRVKDYGKLIPGHGGVLDRVDSLLFTAPVVCWYILLIIMKMEIH